MRNHPRVLAIASGALGILLLAIGVVYLTVACENLPGILGPTPGDTAPRTLLGVVVTVVGLGALTLAILAGRRRPPSTPIQS